MKKEDLDRVIQVRQLLIECHNRRLNLAADTYGASTAMVKQSEVVPYIVGAISQIDSLLADSGVQFAGGPEPESE
jgi:hypothetical protein